MNIWSILGSILSFAGVAITAILGNPEGATTTMLGLQVGKGEVFVAIAAVVLAFSTVISKSGLQSISLGIFSTYRTFMGTIIFFVLANILYGSEHFAEAFAPVLWQWMLIYAAIIVVMGQIFWFAGLRSATAAEINLASSFNPILAIAIAYLLLGEVPSAAQYLGGSIIIVGIVLNLIGSVQPTSRVPRTAKLSAANLMDMEKGFKGL